VTAVQVPIPAELEHQAPIVAHPARFKVLRMGRRWGKDRLAFTAAWWGHGPNECWAGILDGWDVAWLAPDFKQGRGIWNEEIIPRFVNADVPGISVNQTDKNVVLESCGGLYFYTSENVHAIRGLGKRLKGVIINEAAWLDLHKAWFDVILPTLTDNHGWAIIMSTPNAGTDGGLDELENRRVPSYFNTLCEDIRAGTKTDSWAEFSGTAAQNPEIGQEGFDGLVAEYVPDSVTLNQEVYAKLLAPGAGLVFPEWNDDRHTLQTFEVPKHWEYSAGFDWGYWDPSAFVLIATGEESQSVVTRELRWTQTDGYKMGKDIGLLCAKLDRPVRLIAADSSIWGVPTTQGRGFPNMAEEIQGGINAGWTEGGAHGACPWMFSVPKGKDSRLMRVQLLHKYLKAPEGATPRIRFLKSAVNCVTTIPKLPPDPKDMEDVDTASNDHFYDALTYWMMSRPPLVDAPVVPKPRDKHPGLEDRYKTKLQAMGLLPGKPDGDGFSRYRPKKMQRLE
jgi:hypothetical protein